MLTESENKLVEANNNISGITSRIEEYKAKIENSGDKDQDMLTGVDMTKAEYMFDEESSSPGLTIKDSKTISAGSKTAGVAHSTSMVPSASGQYQFNLEVKKDCSFLVVGVAAVGEAESILNSSDKNWGFIASLGMKTHHGKPEPYSSTSHLSGQRLGLTLNRTEGTLIFSSNGEGQGVAYQDDRLKELAVSPYVGISNGMVEVLPSE